MNTLEQLNTRGATQFEFNDSRPATVVFDRVPSLYELNREVNFTSTAVPVTPNIEIQEIVNYLTADVEFKVTVQDLPTSYVEWTSLSQHLTFSQVGDVYTISGFRNVEDWQTARLFNWYVPGTYTTDDLFWLDVELSWYDASLGTRRRLQWVVFDQDYYYVAVLESQHDLDCNGGKLKEFSADITATTLLREYTIDLPPAEFSMSIDATRNIGPIEADLSTVASVECIGTEIALDFNFADNVQTTYDVLGHIGMADNYIVNAFSVGGPGFTIHSVDVNGNLTEDSSFTISSANEPSGGVPSGIYDLDMKVVGNYRYFCQANTVSLPNTGTVRVYRDLNQSGSWTPVLTLGGTSSVKYEQCKYHVTAGGTHYLATKYFTYSGGSWTYQGIRMYRSYNGTSWSQIWSTPFGSSQLENVAMNDNYFVRMPFSAPIIYNINTGAYVDDYELNDFGYNTCLSLLDDILVCAGTAGHKVVNVNTGTVLATRTSSTGWDRVEQTAGYVGLIDFQSKWVIYRTSGNYGIKKGPVFDGNVSDLALSLSGLAVRRQQTGQSDTENNQVVTYK